MRLVVLNLLCHTLSHSRQVITIWTVFDTHLSVQLSELDVCFPQMTLEVGCNKCRPRDFEKETPPEAANKNICLERILLALVDLKYSLYKKLST